MRGNERQFFSMSMKSGTLTSDSPSLSRRNTTSFSASKDDKKEEEESNVAADAASLAAEGGVCKDEELDPEVTRCFSFARKESSAPWLTSPAVVSAPAVEVAVAVAVAPSTVTDGDKLMDENLPVQSKK